MKMFLIFVLVIGIVIGCVIFLQKSGNTKNANLVLPLPVASSQVRTDTLTILNANKIAPEFAGISKWLNPEKPLTIAGLRGKVVLIDFWTNQCINCIHTLPYVTKWYDKYKDSGFVVIGVHTPELAYERTVASVEQAITTYGIHYPVALDNDYSTWKAYDNQYWPAEYLIDKKGIIRRTHFGEGEYEETEQVIQTLLKE